MDSTGTAWERTPARDAHLYTHLLYPADASRVFVSEFTDLVARFAEYLN